MSKMSQVMMEVTDLLLEGQDPATVARIMKVPVQWVLDAEEQLLCLNEPQYEESDYA